MALISAIPQITSLYNSTAPIGSVVQFLVRVVSDTDLTGSQIYFNFYRYAAQALAIPAPTAILPQFGYSSIWPGAPSTVEMAMLPELNNQFYQEPGVFLQTIDLFTFDIVITWVISSDFNDFISSLGRDNLGRLTQDKQPSTLILQNSGTSAFSQTSKTIFHIWATPDGGSTVYPIETALFNQRPSFYGELNTGNASSVNPFIPSFQYRLTTNGEETNCLNPFANTRLEWRAESVAFDSWAAGIFNASNVNNDRDYVSDLQYNYVNVNSAGVKINNFVGIMPDEAFLNATPMSIGPLGNQASITINPDYLTYGAQYYAILVFFKGGIPQASFITDLLSAECCPPPVSGTIVSTIVDYSPDSNIYTDACVRNAVPCERLRVCVSMNKQTYNDTALALGVPGTFDQNFINTRVCIAGDPHIVAGQPVCAGQITDITDADDYTITDSAAQHTQCLDFRVPEEWAGDINRIWFVWIFELTVNNVTYRDEVWYPIKIEVRQIDNEPGGLAVMDHNIIHNGVEDPNVLCADIGVLVDICAILNLPNPETYSFFVMLQENLPNAEILEEDPYVNLNLPQLDAGPITTIDTDYTGGDACFKLDLSQLREDGNYCVKAVAKKQAEQPCDCITLDLTATIGIADSTGLINNLSYIIDWTLAGILVGEINTVTMDVITFEILPPNNELLNNLFGPVNQIIDYGAVVAGSYTAWIQRGADPITGYLFCGSDVAGQLGMISVTFTVSANNGCEYSKTFDIEVQCLTEPVIVQQEEICGLECGCLQVDSTQSVILGNPGVRVEVLQAWSLVGIAMSDVEKVRIDYFDFPAPNTTVSGTVEVFGTNASSFQFPYNAFGNPQSVPDPLNMTYMFQVTLVNGCVYIGTVTHSTCNFVDPSCVQNIISRFCSVNCDIGAEIFEQMEILCTQELALQVTSASVNANASSVTIIYNYTLADYCGATLGVPFNNFTDVALQELSYCYDMQGWDTGGGGYVDFMRVSVANGVVLSGFVDVDMSGTIFPGGDATAFNTWATGTWLTAFEAALGADTLASFGFTAVNGTHYEAVVTTDGFDMQVCFTARNNQSGNWCGPDVLLTEFGDFYPDGSTITEIAIVSNDIVSVLFWETIAVSCGTLHAAAIVGDSVTPIVDGLDGTNNFYRIIPDASAVFDIPEGVVANGITVNYTEDCLVGKILAVNIIDPTNKCMPPTYLWESDQSGSWVIIGTDATLEINNLTAQNIRVTVTCGTCAAQDIIAYP